jgi:hypothetical protein
LARLALADMTLLGVPDRSDSPPNTLAAAHAIIAAQREALLVADLHGCPPLELVAHPRYLRAEP